MASWQASHCLLPCVHDRHPTYFSWTPKYCANKSFYAPNLKMKVHPSHSRSQICKAGQSSGPACMSSSLTGPAHLLNPIIESTSEELPATNLRHLHHSTRPSNTWKITGCHPWMRSPTPSSGTQTAESTLPWDTQIWQSSAIQTRPASLKQAHPCSWQQRFTSSSCPALQGNKFHLTIWCTHPKVAVTGQALQPHWKETRVRQAKLKP